MEAYLKKLCFEYQVDEKEVKELLARMEMVYLDKGETIASATMPEQSLYIIVSGILHTYTTHEGEDRTIRFLSEGDAVLCYNSSQYAVKALTKCAAYYISEEEIEELCATSISFANLVRQLMEYQFYFKEEENMNVRKLTVREKYLSLLAEITSVLSPDTCSCRISGRPNRRSIKPRTDIVKILITLIPIRITGNPFQVIPLADHISPMHAFL